MPRLIIMRGISGSGKSTVAENIRLQNPENAIIVSRDALRLAFYNTAFGPPIDENFISHVERSAIQHGLFKGLVVISDNTNLTPKMVKPLLGMADITGAHAVVCDVDPGIKTAKERNLLRFANGGRLVPSEVIDKQYAAYVKHQDEIHNLVGAYKEL